MNRKRLYSDDELRAMLECEQESSDSEVSLLQNDGSDDEYEPDKSEQDSDCMTTDEDGNEFVTDNESYEERPSDSTNFGWVEPTGNLNDFSCGAASAVSSHCISKLANTDRKPLSFFNLFFDDDVASYIATQTNIYAMQEIAKLVALEKISKKNRLNHWRDTNSEEIRLFFAFLIWMGLDKKPSIPGYWKRNPLYQNQISCYLSRNRFEVLLTFVHFANNETALTDFKLYKIQPLVTMMNERFQLMFEAGENVTIDESMIPFRGRVSFRQYIPNKRHKYGLKIYKLCLVGGYTWNTKMYCGKEVGRPINNSSVTTNLTMELMEPLLDSGRTVYSDNFYTSHDLAERLLSRRTHLIGTLQANRKKNPLRVTKAKLRRGEMKTAQSSHKVIIGNWRDKRNVLFLTTKEVPQMIEVEYSGGRKTMKPSTIVQYNNSNWFIDLSDQLSSYNNTLRRSVKWHRKVAFELLTNIVTVNAHKVYTDVTKKRISITEFREQVVLGVLERQRIHEEESRVNLPQLGDQHQFVENQTQKGCCTVCYDTTCSISGRKAAMKKSKQVKSSCLGCDEKFMCVDCFLNLHKSSLRRRSNP